MTAVKGYISMVQSGDGGEVPVEAGKLLAEAAAESDRMLRLINNMLNVARIEEGRMVYETGEVKLAEVVERVFNEFTFDAQNKALNYTYEPAANISDLVEVDVDRIHEVVANLINNAIKYTDEGSVVARITNPATALVRVEVEDTGPGMTAEEVGKLFQKFYRAESYVGKKMGSGLGLYISRLLVEKFGGKIGVKSQKGKGSIFWFELPTRW
jgi:signal transduction histidine kinase